MKVTRTSPPPFSRMLVGVDLGQSTDFSVLAAVRQTAAKEVKGITRAHYGVVHLHRWPLRTSYAVIVADIGRMFAKTTIAGETKPLAGAALIVDRSGCGRPIFDSLLAAKVNAATIHGLTITAGAKDSADGAAKKNLVAGLIRVLGEERLQVAGGLRLAGELVAEFEAYKATTTAARNTTFGAEHGAHDDLLMAVALAVHWGERTGVAGGSAPRSYESRGISNGFPTAAQFRSGPPPRAWG